MKKLLHLIGEERRGDERRGEGRGKEGRNREGRVREGREGEESEGEEKRDFPKDFIPVIHFLLLSPHLPKFLWPCDQPETFFRT